MRRLPSPRCRGFSLTEVVLALGIVSFAMVAAVGLLPAGLQVVKNSNDQAAAAQVLASLSDSLRRAQSANGTYAFQFAGRTTTFSLNGATNNLSWTNLTLQGDPESTIRNPKRLRADLILISPINSTSPGRATVSVGWSAQSPLLNFDSTTLTWTSAEGSLTSGLVFLPRP